MQVLISWSGRQSHNVGAILHEWFPEVIPGIKPWISSEDIAPGTSWFRSIMDQLEKTTWCVICLTPENVRSPWLYFEAGAIAAKRADTRVCSFLIGVSGSELMAGPLSQFQWLEAKKEGAWKLVREINKSLETPHNETVLENGFDRKWPALKRRLEKAIAELPESLPDETLPLKPVYQLSPEAKELIMEAGADKQGVLMMVHTFGGLHIQTNGKQMGPKGGDPRVVAAWQAAVRELLLNGLLQPLGHQGQVFEVTPEGYRVADELKATKVRGA